MATAIDRRGYRYHLTALSERKEGVDEEKGWVRGRMGGEGVGERKLKQRNGGRGKRKVERWRESRKSVKGGERDGGGGGGRWKERREVGPSRARRP